METDKGNFSICREGDNCWCCPTAEKVAFLIDGADYFESFVETVSKARQTVYIAGWDIDSRLILDRRDRFKSETPLLGDFLNQITRKNRSLHIYILAWDFPLMYLRERQWMPTLHLGWNTSRRVHFELDSEHPIGGSQHQKIVVVDDHIAFCGGLDLTKNRWDTSDHLVEDSRRTDSDGKVYAPFHDLQVAIGGDAAGTLGELFRERWRRATGRRLPKPESETALSWPSGIRVDIASPVSTAIARTLPEYKDRKPVREVEQLYLDAVRSARRWIYIETQYLTADRICKALRDRLTERKPPEILIVMPQKASGWLEQSTMDALRNRRLKDLFENDAHNRLGVYYPAVGDGRVPVYIHSKVMIVDDRLAVVGSANMSNRSMGLDSECCLALEGEPQSDTASTIEGFRKKLLAEHLRVSPEKLSETEQAHGSLIGAVETLRSSGNGLKPLDCETGPLVDGTEWISDQTFLDPEGPFMLDQMLDHFSRAPESGDGGMSRVAKGTGFLIFLLALAAAWRWSPLADWISEGQLARWAGMLNDIPLIMAAVVGGFLVGGLVFAPITAMIGASALLLPPWQSFVSALAGTILNAWATYLLGRYMGKEIVRKLAGSRLDRLNSLLARRGILTMALVRNIPVAPFSVLNVVAGTTGIRLSHYLLGTALGMLPGIIAITIFTDRMLAVIRNPSWINFAAAFCIAVGMGVGFWWLKKRLERKETI